MGNRFVSFVLSKKGQAVLHRWGFRYRPVPAIKQLEETSGTVGSSVVIDGTNFGGNKPGYVPGVVKFGNTIATTTAWSATQITATVPNLAAGAYKVTVTADGQVSKASKAPTFTVTP